jgi:hypothetical protein
VAGRTLTVTMADDDLIPAWQTVIELARNGVSAGWTLVGGLMVYAHARRAGIVMNRPTDDVDVLVDYWANRASLSQAQSALGKLGFRISQDEKHAYRFRHEDGRKVDLMVADHLPSQMAPRLDRRPAFAAPAGEQAIRRRDIYNLRFASGEVATVGVPDELGALVAKGAGWLVDRRDRTRHLDDCAVLLAGISDASTFDYATMSRNDRKRIMAIAQELGDPSHPSWINVDEPGRSQGTLTLALMRQILSPA